MRLARTRRNAFDREPGGPVLEPGGGGSIRLFFILAFAVSWAGYVPLVVHSFHPARFAHPAWRASLILPGVGPTVAAIWLRCMEGRPLRAVLQALEQSFTKRLPQTHWLVTSALAFCIPASAAVATRVWSGAHPPLLRSSPLSAFLLFGVLSLFANPCEEIGWRGFAQKRLQRHMSALPSALLVGCVWAAWHIPLFLVATGPIAMANVPFWLWAAGVPTQAVLLAWLFNRSGQSLAIASLFHVLTNIFSSIFLPSWEMTALTRLIAATFVVVWTKGRLAESSSSITT